VASAGAATAAAVALGVTFSWAAVAKTRHRSATLVAFRELGLPAPRGLTTAVPAAEVGATAMLLARPAVGGTMSLALLGVFTVVMVRGLAAGVRTGCGCFGQASASRPLAAADVARNGLLGALAVIATGASRPVFPSSWDVVVIAGAVLAGAGALAVLRRL